jgi:cell division protein FtsB
VDNVADLLGPGAQIGVLGVLLALVFRTLWRTDNTYERQSAAWKRIADELREEMDRREKEYREELTRLRQEIADLKAD